MLDYLLSDAVPLGELVFEPLNLMKKKSSTEEKSKTSEYIDEFIKGVKVLSK